MSTRRRVFVTNDPQAMRINKELAREIGFQDSIVFLQLEFLISISSEAHVIDGKRWTRQSLEDLHEQFPWWSVMTIKRIIARLEERGLIVIGQFNKAGYDRTQWYAIDEEGAGNLHSIAIYQIDKSKGSDCEMEELNLINGRAQFDTTIPETTEKDIEERDTNVSPKKVKTFVKPKKLKVTNDEAEARWEALLSEDENADVLKDLAALKAAENQTGEIKLATLWRQIGDDYVRAKERLSLEALRYGLEEALRREKPSIRYALAVARNYRPRGPGEERPRHSIAVIGATDADYNPEEYRFHE